MRVLDDEWGGGRVFVGGMPVEETAWASLSEDERAAMVGEKNKERNARLDVQIEGIVSSGERVLFMKGTKERPRCKFSRRCVEALDAAGVEYIGFDILSSWDIRHRMKTYSGQATYPQLWEHGVLVGGTDAVVAWIATQQPQ